MPVRKIINNTPPNGFRWTVVEGQQVLRSGTAKSRTEADADADDAIRELEAEASKTAKDK